MLEPRLFGFWQKAPLLLTRRLTAKRKSGLQERGKTFQRMTCFFFVCFLFPTNSEKNWKKLTTIKQKSRWQLKFCFFCLKASEDQNCFVFFCLFVFFSLFKDNIVIIEQSTGQWSQTTYPPFLCKRHQGHHCEKKTPPPPMSEKWLRNIKIFPNL